MVVVVVVAMAVVVVMMVIKDKSRKSILSNYLDRSCSNAFQQSPHEGGGGEKEGR